MSLQCLINSGCLTPCPLLLHYCEILCLSTFQRWRSVNNHFLSDETSDNNPLLVWNSGESCDSIVSRDWREILILNDLCVRCWWCLCGHWLCIYLLIRSDTDNLLRGDSSGCMWLMATLLSLSPDTQYTALFSRSWLSILVSISPSIRALHCKVSHCLPPVTSLMPST